MSFDADEEILQDFLVEAGEILELLSEQLVELEGSPDDMNLLNAIFRGFHTVKGGAGFLQLNELVACCHIAENVFDILRKGERRVTSDLMDVVLQALDSVNAMFQEVREGKPLTPATDELLEALASLAEPSTANEQTNNSSSAMSAETADQVDAEFEQLLEAIPASHIAPSVESSSMDDLITDDEFEALLDQLHGEGKFSVEDASSSIKAEDNAMTSTTTTSSAADPALISDDEFESLLDQLHGKGKFKVTVKNSEESPVTPVNDTPVKKDSVSAKPAAIVKTPAATAKPATSQATEVETTVRVDTARLDDIMNMVGELVLVRNRLVRLGLSSGDETMAKVVGHLDVVTGDLQSAVMKTRMQPIKKVFGRFPRLVRDMARNLKKEIRLELVGEETDLDKNLVEALADPLVHLVRNSVDHGIESPAEREAAGKNREGCVILSAAQEGDHIQLTISDDGKGMDANVLRNKAIEKGMLEKEAAERLTDLECYNLIFAPGFSTKTEISDVSGRGVGMDVVKTKITQLNGTVNVFSTPGQGSQVVIKVPLTLAIMPTLMVMLGNQAFAFPLVNVNEIFHLDLSRTNIVDGQEVVIVREKALPLFYLKNWLLPKQVHADQVEGHVVILTVGNQRIGCVVDQLVGQEEVVIKPLGKMLHGTPGMSGATITGDGRIALILDIPGLLKNYGQRY